MMKPTIKKKAVDTKKQKREQSNFDILLLTKSKNWGFNIYLSGANAERVNDQLKREKNEGNKSQSRDSRRGWSISKKVDDAIV